MRRHIDHIEGANYERGYVYDTHYHLVWVTKYRRKIFMAPELAKEMEALLLSIAKSAGITVEAVEVLPDYIHMTVSFKPKMAATDAVKTLKGRSGRFFLEAHPELKSDKLLGGHLWSNSYYLATEGRTMSSDIVKRYVENQYVKAADDEKAAGFSHD